MAEADHLVGQLFPLSPTLTPTFLIFLQEYVLIHIFPKDNSTVGCNKLIPLCISGAQGAMRAVRGETAVRLRPWQLERFIRETMKYNFIEDYSIWRLTDGSGTKFGTLIQQRDSADVTSTWAVCSSVGFSRVLVAYFSPLPQAAIEPLELIQPCSHSKAICCSN